MGNSGHKYENLKLNLKDWDKTGETPMFQQMRNKNTRVQGDYYHFNIPETQDIDDELQLYDYRYTTNNNVVKTLGVNSDKNGFGFCGSQMLVRVMTQKIVKKLCEIKNLNDRDQLSILYNSLAGYSSIHKKIGSCKVSSDMIGFNEHGQTKVWVNPNLGMNKKQDLRPDDETPQNTMIRDIIEAVQSSSASHQIPRQLKNNLLATNSLSEASQKVSQFVGGDRNVLHNFVKVNDLQMNQNNQIAYQHNSLPPVNYHQEQMYQPRNVPALQSSNYAQQQPMTQQRQTVHPIGPFSHQIKDPQEQTRSRFITLSGKNENPNIMPQNQNANRPISNFNNNVKVTESTPYVNSSNIRFSYDKSKY